MESRDPHAGLFGPIIITSEEMASEDGTPKDVDRCGARGRLRGGRPGRGLSCAALKSGSRCLLCWLLTLHRAPTPTLHLPTQTARSPQGVCPVVLHPGREQELPAGQQHPQVPAQGGGTWGHRGGGAGCCGLPGVALAAGNGPGARRLADSRALTLRTARLSPTPPQVAANESAAAAVKEDAGFIEANLKHSINGCATGARAPPLRPAARAGHSQQTP
jgi:hypothetical protein